MGLVELIILMHQEPCAIAPLTKSIGTTLAGNRGRVRRLQLSSSPEYPTSNTITLTRTHLKISIHLTLLISIHGTMHYVGYQLPALRQEMGGGCGRISQTGRSPPAPRTSPAPAGRGCRGRYQCDPYHHCRE